MKVSDVMSREVDYVTANTSVREVCRVIFGRGINGVPVCKERKVVGFITERDIFDKFYPTMEEYMEDPLHSTNFEGMEGKISEIFRLTADKIMSKNPITVTAETPLLRAQSLMATKKVGRLPVINENGHLVGMIAKGDIFRAVVGDKLPHSNEEQYHDWLSKHYDFVVKWDERLGYEIPDLVSLFKGAKVKSVIDIGCGTGEHDIALAQKGYSVTGIESSPLMNRSSNQKYQKLPSTVKERLHFINGEYPKLLLDMPQKFDAAIFMGNAFAHLANNYKEVLTLTAKSLLPEDSMIVMQLINFEKVFKVRKRFLDFNFTQSKLGLLYEHGFLEYYDPPKKGRPVTLNMVIFDFDGKKWKYRSLNSTPIVPLNKLEITKLLRKKGFKDISFYGGMFSGPLFRSPFKPLESDWLNVVARR